MPRFLSRSSPRMFGLGVVVAVVGVLQGSYWIIHAERAGVSTVCAEWDEAAKRTLAPLLHRTNLVGADRDLLDQLATLRRARHHCAADRLDLARRDYDSLLGLSGLAFSSAQD